MKKLCVFSCFVFLLFCNSISYSQELSIGLLSGINFSDIHGNNNSGKWKFKPGASEKIIANYNLNRVIGFQSGLSFSSIYYEHLPYVDRTDYPEIEYIYPLFVPVQYPYNQKMDFTFLSIPAQFKITIPSRPQLHISGGVFYSFLIDYGLNYYSIIEPEKNDFGFLFSAGLSYPLADKFNASLNFGYLAGRKKFLDGYDYRHGSMDITFGISYDGFMKGKKEKYRIDLQDSSHSNIDLIYKAGINFIWNSCSLNPDMYELASGPSLGFAVDFSLSHWLSLQTGISYEKNGYALRDSSDLFDRYFVSGDPQYSVGTKIGIDYITIPALVNLSFGREYRFFLNTGPYLAVKLNAFCKGEAFSAMNSGPQFQMKKTVVFDDIGGLIKDTDFGWMVGGGVTLPVTEKIKVDLGLQYHKGFSDAGRPVNMQESYETDKGATLIRNNSFSLQVGLRLPVH